MGARGLLITQETLFGENRRGKDFMRSKNKSGVFSRCALLLIGVVVFGARAGYSHPKKEPKGRCFGVRISENDFGFVDESGQVIISGRNYVSPFFNGRAWYRNGNRYYLIDNQCDVVSSYLVSKRKSQAGGFGEGISCLHVGGETNYLVSISGAIISTNSADHVLSFSGGVLSFKKDGKWGCYSPKGKVVIKNTFYFIFTFSNGLALSGVKHDNGDVLWGYINRSGDYVIPPKYTRGCPFSDGLAVVQKDGECFCINPFGKCVLKMSGVEEMEYFSEGVVPVKMKKSSKWGWVDRSGKWIVKPTYYWAGIFKEGLINVTPSKGGLSGYANMDGKMQIKPQFLFCKPFENGFARVKWRDGSEGIIDHSGNVVWRK